MNHPCRVFPQECVNPRKLKVSGFPSPRRRRCSAASRPNSIRRVLSGCSAQSVGCEAGPQLGQEPLGIHPMLKTHDEIIGIAHDHHVALRLCLSPLVDPAVEHFVPVEVGQEWTDVPALTVPSLHTRVPFSSTPACNHFWMSARRAGLQGGAP